MQQDKKIKIPINLIYKIQQYQSNNQLLYFTIFDIKTTSYVIDISTSKISEFPLFIGDEYKFKQIQEKINKDNKNQVLAKYDVCSCDQINLMCQKFMVINLRIQGNIGIPVQILGYCVQIKKNKQFDRKITNYQNFHQILKNCQEDAKQIWSNYNGRYCRSLSDKKNKVETDITFGLQPFLQYQVSVMTVPKFDAKPIRKIDQYTGYISQYGLLFEIKEQQLPNISDKIHNFVKQKLLSQEKSKPNPQSISFFNCPRANPKKIFNPHIYARYTKKQKYELIMAKGVYEYYHYGDQGFTDNGWGCAYRALQTLISWLNIQGHTEPMSDMMSIRAIQEKLDQFDRSRKLKGSSTWIGATEISWIVPTLTIPQVNCKILHISDGKNILQKCEEFKNHFLTSGCPIMYGGGQYAYSIVGMHYNWKLGQCQFLILDPHYTGEDDFGKIIEKKGLAWRKPEEMFKKGVFYNFCLPLIK